MVIIITIIFGTNLIGADTMNCGLLANNDPNWLPCILNLNSCKKQRLDTDPYITPLKPHLLYWL